MFTICLTTADAAGIFHAGPIEESSGKISFRFTGPRQVTVDQMEVTAGMFARKLSCALLDELHRYAQEKDLLIRFDCPKAKALNDQQITQELLALSLHDVAAA